MDTLEPVSCMCQEGVESFLGLFLGLGHPDLVQVGLGSCVHALGPLVQHVPRLVHPAGLLAGLRTDFRQGGPRSLSPRRRRPTSEPGSDAAASNRSAPPNNTACSRGERPPRRVSFHLPGGNSRRSRRPKGTRTVFPLRSRRLRASYFWLRWSFRRRITLGRGPWRPLAFTVEPLEELVTQQLLIALDPASLVEIERRRSKRACAASPGGGRRFGTSATMPLLVNAISIPVPHCHSDKL